MTRLALALTALMAALLGCRDPYQTPRFLGAGSVTPRRGGTLRFAYDADIATTDPALTNDTVAGIPTRLMYEGLVNYAPGSAELVPALASGWRVSPDGRAFTFALRDNIRFANGRAITCDDFVYSWERALDARRLPSPGAENFRLIEGFDAYRGGRAAHLSGLSCADSRHFVVRLTAADQTFLNVVAMRFAAAVPREVVEAMGDERFGREGLGAGPFVLERWEPNVRVVLRRNPYYYDAPRPWLDRVVFELSVARHLQYMRFLAGELELAHTYSLSTADYVSVLRNPAWRPYVTRTPGATIGALLTNCEMPPFDNVHVRRAVTFAVDRDSLCRARNYRITPAATLYPPGIPGHRAQPPGAQRFDLAAARRELSLAGHPEGLADEVELWIGDGDAGLVYGQLLQADLARIGIRVRIKQASNSVYYTSLGRRHTVKMAFTGWAMDYPDPSNFIEPNFHSRGIAEDGSSNHAFYRNPSLDALLDRAKIEGDRARRLRMYQDAEDILLNDAPWTFMTTPVDVHVVQPYVRNFTPHPVWNEYVGDTWLDLPTRAFMLSESRRRSGYGPLAFLAASLGGL
ncbi:MAG: ABC transporter substrate-binding protein [Myxococcales bacterium]|nr:ABC transporter substrate-binding protein [Myxococcales bacterium]